MAGRGREFFLSKLFLFFTVDFHGKKTKAEHNVAVPETP